MSRSQKGSKGPGYEYWSKRPCNGFSPGSDIKRMTHKLERLEAKAEINEGVRDLDTALDFHDEIEDALYCHSFGPCRKCKEAL